MYISQINNSNLSTASIDIFEQNLIENQPLALRPSQVQNTAEVIESSAEVLGRTFRGLATSVGIGLGLGIASVALIGMSDDSVDTVETVSSRVAAAFGLAGLTVACVKGLVAAMAHYVSPMEAMTAENAAQIDEIDEVETDSEAETDLEVDVLSFVKKSN